MLFTNLILLTSLLCTRPINNDDTFYNFFLNWNIIEKEYKLKGVVTINQLDSTSYEFYGTTINNNFTFNWKCYIKESDIISITTYNYYVNNEKANEYTLEYNKQILQFKYLFKIYWKKYISTLHQ